MIIELARARQWRDDLSRHGQNAALRARGKVLLDTLPTIRDETMAAKKCAFCGIEFIGRKDARFCSDVHRAAANRRKDERGPSELAEKLRSAAQADDLYVASIGSVDAGKHKRARNVALHEAHAAIEVELGIVHKSTEVEAPVLTPVDVVELGQAQEPNASRTEVEAPVLTPVDVVEPNAIASTSDDVRAKLASFMKQTKMTQSQVGKALHMSQAQISRFLGGKIVLSPNDCEAIEKMINGNN